MEIIAKKGSKLEQQIRKDYETKMSSYKEAEEIIFKHTGVKPSSIGYRWFFGYTCMFDYNEIDFNEKDVIENEKFLKVLKFNKRSSCYTPIRKTIAGKEFEKEFNHKMMLNKDKYLHSESYLEYGIKFVDGARYFWWEPILRNGVYSIACGDSMFSSVQLDHEQYTISNK